MIWVGFSSLSSSAILDSGWSLGKSYSSCDVTSYEVRRKRTRNTVVWGYPFSAHEIIFGLVFKENDSVVKSVRNLDVKCEVQMCPCTFADDAKKNQPILSSTVFTNHNG